MESKVKVLGHALHQMLVVFPLGLLTAAAIFDVIYLISRVPVWTQSASPRESSSRWSVVLLS